MSSAILETHNYNEPEEFLEALRGSNDALWNELPEYWVYRGHADIRWELLPSALRKNSKLTHSAEKAPGPYTRADDQVAAEIQNVREFAAVANRHGLAVPGGLNTARRLLSRSIENGSVFPPFELWDLFAIAQHHGVPTRLMDWSRRPLIATYFAAHGAADMMNSKDLAPDQHLGVWALNTTFLGRSHGDEVVHLVDPPRFGNPNLIAQDGVFTVHWHNIVLDDPPLCEQLHTTLSRHVQGQIKGIGVAMRLLTLPAKKARKLLARLESEGIAAAGIFPGYDGVARELSEKITHSDTAWRAPPREE